MHIHALTYPSLQRRLISQRRSRAFSAPRTAQQVRSRPLLIELARATVALGAVAAWAALMLLLAA